MQPRIMRSLYSHYSAIGGGHHRQRIIRRRSRRIPEKLQYENGDEPKRERPPPIEQNRQEQCNSDGRRQIGPSLACNNRMRIFDRHLFVSVYRVACPGLALLYCLICLVDDLIDGLFGSVADLPRIFGLRSLGIASHKQKRKRCRQY